MTIGIVCGGPNAGLAVFLALRSVERVATGSIGGFAAFAAISANGQAHEYATARGGTSTLFIDGETTGVDPAPEVAAARIAAVISSGPDRPEPLNQFLRVDPAAGIVCGHRLPNAAGASGLPFNEEVLAALRSGRPAAAAVDGVLDANSEGDVGLIAADRLGHIYARNSARVARRPDLGQARRENRIVGAVVEILHNAIGPGPSIAELAADTALAVMARNGNPDGWVVVEAGTPVELGDRSRVELDNHGHVQRIVTTDSGLLHGRRNGAAIYLDAEVRRDGQLLGRTTFEPNIVLQDGQIVSLSGQTRMRLGYRRTD
jgi:hypothetical protein